MTPLLALLLSVALAGTTQDLAQAADADLPEAARTAAFERVVTAGTTDLGVVGRVAMNDKADTRTRWVAVRALGQIRGDQAKTMLLELTENPEPAIRAAATQALGDFGDARVGPTLHGRLDDPAIIVRAAAAEALCRVGDASAVAPLDRALSAKDNYYRGRSLWVRRHYVAALGCIGSREAIPVLLRLLDDADDSVVASSVLAFRDIAGFSYGDGRSKAQELEAWRRWANDQLK